MAVPQHEISGAAVQPQQKYLSVWFDMDGNNFHCWADIFKFYSHLFNKIVSHNISWCYVIRALKNCIIHAFHTVSQLFSTSQKQQLAANFVTFRSNMPIMSYNVPLVVGTKFPVTAVSCKGTSRYELLAHLQCCLCHVSGGCGLCHKVQDILPLQ